MRLTSKSNTGKHGISAANCYRTSIKSAATDIEALVDAYDVTDLFRAIVAIRDSIHEHGDSLINTSVNLWLNQQAIPAIRKQHKAKGKRCK